MSRFAPTGAVDVPGLAHSVADLPWGVLRGALGPSDGSAGAASNVPSALAVLRHAQLYLPFPAEIDDAFRVLEQHAIRHGLLYPVAVAAVPFLFDIIRRGSPLAERIGDVLATYAAAFDPLEPKLHERLATLLAAHAVEVAGWLGRLDRAACALAIHVPAMRGELLAAIERADRVSSEVLIALVELGAAPGRTIELALAMLDAADAAGPRACAAAFLARFGDRSPALSTRIDAALPPSAPALLREHVRGLWSPTIERPVVAPKLYDAEVVFADARLVLVRAGSRSVALPWERSNVTRGARVQVGLTAHGLPKLVVVTDADGSVRVIDF